MTTVRVTSEINLDQLLDGMAQLETADLERLGTHISTLLAQRKAASLPQSETELLQHINQGLPEETQQRYHHLQAKLQAETITPAEHQELLTLIDTVEQADSDRLQHLLTLAQLRQVPRNELLAQLGLQPPAVHA